MQCDFLCLFDWGNILTGMIHGQDFLFVVFLCFYHLEWSGHLKDCKLDFAHQLLTFRML